MLYAHDEHGGRITAAPKAVGYCPACEKKLVPHCGKIYVHHWSHKGDKTCDPWMEPETDWHAKWKYRVDRDYCEVRVGSHVADIIGNNGVVIELQAGSLSADQIVQREEYYRDRGGMVWLIDAREFRPRVLLRNRGTHYTFRWKQPRRSYCFARMPMFWDFGDGRIFDVRKVYDNIPCGGWGMLLKTSAFVEEYLSHVLNED